MVVRQADSSDLARYSVPFGPSHTAALSGYLPYGAAAARKLEVERKRLMGYATVMLASGVPEPDADPVAIVSALKATARSLRLAGIGNGSWVSAAQGLTGKRALDVLARVLDGELVCDPGITPADIVKAMAIAQLLAPKA